MRSKRGGGHVRGESVFGRADRGEQTEAGIADVLGSEPTPELANMLVENTQQLLDSLQDESLAQIARMKLEGWPNDEIAHELGCVRRTVERKIERIREKWAKGELGEMPARPRPPGPPRETSSLTLRVTPSRTLSAQSLDRREKRNEPRGCDYRPTTVRVCRERRSARRRARRLISLGFS